MFPKMPFLTIVLRVAENVHIMFVILPNMKLRRGETKPLPRDLKNFNILTCTLSMLLYFEVNTQAKDVMFFKKEHERSTRDRLRDFIMFTCISVF